MSDIVFEKNKASSILIEKHLLRCSLAFVPPLESYVDIPQYAIKIEQYADTFEAWHNQELVSLVACYFNGETRNLGYITNVSTLPSFQGENVTKHLFQMLRTHALERKIIVLGLHVNKLNLKAISFYEKEGFVIDVEESSQDTLHMIHCLSNIISVH